MAQTPKNFVIERVAISPTEVHRVRNSATTAVPTRFVATLYLAEPRLVVEMVVRVAVGGGARVTDLRVETDPRESISTTTLRRVLVDPMLRAALDAASVRVADRSGLHPRAFELVGEEGRVAHIDGGPVNERAVRAAQVYTDALASGSKAPTEAVALELRVSKAQASRYVRAAREAGLLPPLGG